MRCAGDPVPLPDETVAARSADLARVAEQAARDAGVAPPVYVIGTEVPVPGGESALGSGVAVTRPQAAAQTLQIHQSAFAAPDLQPAWARVIGLVVQPGVDFDHSSVQHYDADAATALSDFIGAQPRIVFEAHSTDYQAEAGLHALVRDHYAILKVGPALTFALREALFALSFIEDAMAEAGLLADAERARLPEVLDAAMLANPKHWQRHYQGDAAQLRFLRQYALSDRCRYYWGEPPVQAAVQRLFDNLQRHAPPLPLLGQFLPVQAEAVTAGTLPATPQAWVEHHIRERLAQYARACVRNTAPTRAH